MDNHELLQEKYDDALFALLMNERADSEGSRLIRENEALLQDPSSEVPKESERRFLRTIDRETFRNAHKRTNKKVLRFIGRLALGALIAVLLFGTAFALSPAFRAATLNLLMKIDEKTASWELITGETSVSQESFSLDDISINWVPEGFVQIIPEYYNPTSFSVLLTKPTGESIIVTVIKEYSSGYSLDIEKAGSYSEVTISDSDGIIVRKDDTIRLSWIDEDTGYFVLITSEFIDEETMICLANNISFSDSVLQ